MRQNINQLVEKGGGQLSDAIMKSGEYTCIANEFSSGRKKIGQNYPYYFKESIFWEGCSSSVVVACGRVPFCSIRI